MPKVKLTKRAIEKLPAPDPSGKQTLWWDEDLRGFAVLCSGRTNSKTYIVQRDRPGGGSTQRVTVAAVNELSLAEAREHAAAMLVAMRRGEDPKHRAATGTLQQVLNAYLEARRDLRPTTANEYRYSVQRYLRPLLGRPLGEITREKVEKRHSEVGEEHGPAAANGCMRALRLLWNWQADRDPDLPANPVRLRGQWFPNPRRERLVGADKLPAFFGAVNKLSNPVARDYLLLLLFTGLRRSEAASLTWDDVDLVQKVIRVPASRTKAGRKLDLPMSGFVYDLLAARREIGRDKFVFPSSGKNGHLAEPKFPLRRVADASGVEVSAHDLRRTFITVAESTDISPLALKALVNHSLGNDVTSGYVQMTAERLREPAEKVANRMGALCKITESSS